MLPHLLCRWNRAPNTTLGQLWLGRWKWKWTGDLFYLEKSRQESDKDSVDVSFDDVVCTFKSQIKGLKEHIFVKNVQDDAYNKHKAESSDGDLLAQNLK